MTENEALSEAVLQRHKESLTRFRKLPVVERILARLAQELPEDLSYHNAVHVADVLSETVLFGVVGELAERELELLAVAAAYHDAGFLEGREEHEQRGAVLVRADLEQSGQYSTSEIEQIAQMILDTRLIETRTGPQRTASSELSRYLLDADLSNLGRDDFFTQGERLMRELGLSEDVYLQKTWELVSSHVWFTPAAQKLREEQKDKNVVELKRRLEQQRHSNRHLRYLGVSLDTLAFLTSLPMALTSSLDTQRIVEHALEQVLSRVGANAATVFLCEPGSAELTFWALHGGSSQRLKGRRMPRQKGIVGWVIEKREGVLVQDAANDPRFFGQIDLESDFVTRDVICVPLMVRGNAVIGAMQVLNSTQEGGFVYEDLVFLEHVAHQFALAVDNARLYAEVVEHGKKLAALDRRKTEMLTVVSHEFGTPLNVIQNAAEMLDPASTLDKSTQARLHTALTNSIERLVRLLVDVRNVSLVSADDFHLAKQRVPVSELLEGLVVQYRTAAQERELEISISIEPQECSVEADPALLTMVLSNLLSNAVRFTADGGRISVRAERHAGHVQFSVIDTGIGIEQSEIPLIFEKFYEVSDIMQHSSGNLGFKSGGLGLGLPTVRAIVEAHGSKVEVSSQVGEGSTFRFCLAAID